MNDSRWRDELGPHLLQLQIVVGALVAGCAMFLVIVLVIDLGRPQGNDLPLITYTALAFALTALVARIIVRSAMINSGRRKIARGTWRPSQQWAARVVQFLEKTGDAGRLWIVLQTTTIVSAAMLEGPAFFALIAYMIEGRLLSLVLAILLIVGVALQMPTRSRAAHWIEDQLQQVEQERLLAP